MLERNSQPDNSRLVAISTRARTRQCKYSWECRGARLDKREADGAPVMTVVREPNFGAGALAIFADILGSF